MPQPPYAIIHTTSHRRPRYGLLVLIALVLAGAGVTAALVLRPAGVLPEAGVTQSPPASAEQAASVALALRSASVCITCGTVEKVQTVEPMAASGDGKSDGKGDGKADGKGDGKAATTYRVQVRMDDGSLRSFTSATQPQPGASVRVQGENFRVVGGG